MTLHNILFNKYIVFKNGKQSFSGKSSILLRFLKISEFSSYSKKLSKFNHVRRTNYMISSKQNQSFYLNSPRELLVKFSYMAIIMCQCPIQDGSNDGQVQQVHKN